jgi:histidinol-phosphate/aromatic aminotransferase/cobyric acid decarboxylase-like protein
VKRNIWLFVLGVVIGIVSGYRSGYAVAHRELYPELVREREKWTLSKLSALQQEETVERKLKMQRELASKAAAYCTLHHGSFEGFDKDAVVKELEKEYGSGASKP